MSGRSFYSGDVYGDMILGYKSTRQFFNTYAFILAVCIVAFCVRLGKIELIGWPLQMYIFISSIVLITLFWESLRFINIWLGRVLPLEKNIPKRIFVQLVLGGLMGALVRALIYFFGEPYIPFKLDELFLAATWALYIMLPTVINLGFLTVQFIDRWKDSIVRAERLEKEKSQVQFDNLKNQLNPHFLFNALTSLNNLIIEDQLLASQFLQQLSKVYRYVLQNKDKNFVSVQTELEFIQHYISLLKTRFREALFITTDIRPDAEERAIVPVTLQILIENAIKHNVVDKDRPLQIEVITIGGYLVVSNNLQVRKRVETSNKQGLENLRSLYNFLTDQPVLIEQTDSRFSVKVPLL